MDQPSGESVCGDGRDPAIIAKLATQPKHPTYEPLFYPTFCDTYELLDLWACAFRVTLPSLPLDPQEIHPGMPCTQPATSDVLDPREANISSLTYRRYFAELPSAYQDHTAMYSDASFVQGFIFSYRLQF